MTQFILNILTDGRLGCIEHKLDALITPTKKAERNAAGGRVKRKRAGAKGRKLGKDLERRLVSLEAAQQGRVLPVIERIERVERWATGAIWAGSAVVWGLRKIVWLAGLVACCEQLLALLA